MGEVSQQDASAQLAQPFLC